MKDVYGFACSFAQRRLWFLDQLTPHSSFYNIPAALRMDSAVDPGVLERAVNGLARRHESLRTTFGAPHGEPVQFVAAELNLSVSVTFVESFSEAERLAALEAGRPFDLEKGPLLRVNLLRLSERDHVLLVTLHHIISDGWSMEIFFRELVALYAAESEGKAAALPALPIQYADYAAWEQEWLSGERLTLQTRYWKQQLAGLPLLEVPADRPRPAMASYRGSRETFRLDAALSNELKQLAQSEKTTLFMTLLAAFEVLLYRYSGQDDFAIGTLTAGRGRAETEGLIGFFVNTLALRADMRGSPSFRELLARVKETALEAYAHAELPFEKLVEELHPQRDLSRNPLVQVTFQLFNPLPPRAGEAGAEVTELLDIPKATVKFDLALDMWEQDGGLNGRMDYSTDLWEAGTIGRMLRHFDTLLHAIIREPDGRIDVFSLLTGGEFDQQIDHWNRTERPYRRDSRVNELFEEQAARVPHAVAIIDGREAITYQDLDDRAEDFAAALRLHGVAPGDLIGVCLPRSWALVAALLGVWKAGAAYVALDPAYPAKRLEYMLGDSGASFVIRETGVHCCAPATSGRAVPATVAYVLYTSGSTGQPKGVVIEHRNTVALIEWALDFYPRGELDGVLASTSVCFDLSIFEMFVPLSCGGTVIMAENALHLPSLPAAGSVTLINTVPSAAAELARLRAIPASIRSMNLAGEPLDAELPRLIFSNSRVETIQNLYGPTEDTTYSTCARITRGERWLPGIGRPIANRRSYILDRLLQPVPLGVTGELYLGGAGVALGYLNRPELTAERFLHSPFVAGDRLYKTGDLARYRPDGQIEYGGRSDGQIKLRGYRIEPGEIESALRRCPNVRDAAVLMRDNPAGEPRLVAWFVPEDSGVSVGEIRAALELSLPQHMVPAVFVPLARLPLTPNGKLDRAALPNPEPRPARDRLVAKGETEKCVAAIWSEVLGIPEPGIDDNFFELGGHSLLLLRVQDRLRNAVGEISVIDLFRYPTIRALTGHLTVRGKQSGHGFVAAQERARKQRERLHVRNA